MQEVKNKLAMFNALRCSDSAAADLELLAQRCPQHPDLARFMFSPERNADDILFALLDHATADEIIDNRLEKADRKNNDDGGTPNTNPETEGGTPPDGDAGQPLAEGEGGQTTDGGATEPPAADNDAEQEGEALPTQTDGLLPVSDTENQSGQPTESPNLPQDKTPTAPDAKKK